jgi:hypothetical protein
MGQWGCVGSMYMQDYTHGQIRLETNQYPRLKVTSLRIATAVKQ